PGTSMAGRLVPVDAAGNDGEGTGEEGLGLAEAVRLHRRPEEHGTRAAGTAYVPGQSGTIGASKEPADVSSVPPAGSPMQPNGARKPRSAVRFPDAIPSITRPRARKVPLSVRSPAVAEKRSEPRAVFRKASEETCPVAPLMWMSA